MTTARQRRAPRMTKTASRLSYEVPHRLGLDDERIQNERVLVSGAFRRRVAVFAKMNGYNMPLAWRKLAEAGLAAQQNQGEVSNGFVARTEQGAPAPKHGV